MKKIYLKHLEEDMYKEYKLSQFSKGKIPLDIVQWKKELDDPTTVLKKEKIDIKSDFYTYEEAATLLKRTVSTLKAWIRNEENEIVLIDKNKIEKNCIDILVLKFQKNHEDFLLKQEYEEYVRKAFEVKEEPYEYEKWCKDKNNETKNPIDLNIYIHFNEALNILGISELTLKAYIRNGSFNVLVNGFTDYLLKDDVILYRKRTADANLKRQQEKIIIKEKKEKEKELEKLLENCIIGGYIRCNNSYIRENLITRILCCHNTIQIMSKSKSELNTPSLLADENGNIITFKSKNEINLALKILLKYIERYNQYKY